MFISAKIATSQGVVEIASVDGQPMRRGTPVTVTIDGETRDFPAPMGIFARNPEVAKDAIMASGAFDVPGFVARIQEKAVAGFNAQSPGDRSVAQRDGVKTSIINLLKMAKSTRPAQDIVARARDAATMLFPWDENPDDRISQIRNRMAHISPAVQRDIRLIEDVRSALNAAVQAYSDTFVDVPDLDLDDIDHDGPDAPAPEVAAPAPASPVVRVAPKVEAAPVAPARVATAEIDPEDADYLAAEDGILGAEWDTDEVPAAAATADDAEAELDDEEIVIPTWPVAQPAPQPAAEPRAQVAKRPVTMSAERPVKAASADVDEDIPVLDAPKPAQGDLFGAAPADAGNGTPVFTFDDPDFR